MTERRQRTDTIAGAVNSFEGATKLFDPPAHCWVPENAKPFWYSIVQARAANRWNEADLEIAAELARCRATIERLNRELGEEDDIVINAKGTPVVNPKHSLLETLTRRMVALSRALQVHAEATQGKSRDQVKGNKAQQQARETVDDLDDDDDLIATPGH